jgi:hypothetical protein
MRKILFSLFVLSLFWLGCRKEPLQFNGKTATIQFDSNVNQNPTYTDPNCTAFNPSDFPATGAAQGRVVVNGRVTQLDGSRKAGTKLWLFDGLNVVSQLETDANGKFKFDVATDTASAAYYYVVVNPIVFGPPTLIPRYNCGTYNNIQKNKIQNLDITFCEGAAVRLKAIKSTDADSVYINGTMVNYCNQQPDKFGFANQKTDDLIAFLKTFSAGYPYTVLRNSNLPITIERTKNGVKTKEVRTIKADSLSQTITLEL